MLLTRYGFREWFIITAVAALVIAVAGFLAWMWLAIAAFVLWAALASFFRDPLFRKPATNNACDLVSPADGLVSAVLEVPTHPATNGRATIVRIYLSVLDVHINRSPCVCTVTALDHTPGKYLDVRIEESAAVNEHLLMRCTTSSGIAFGVKQIAGKVARMIVNPQQAANTLTRGERYGMIKFGSTTELIFPTDEVESIAVKQGQRVTGGVTVLLRAKRV